MLLTTDSHLEHDSPLTFTWKNGCAKSACRMRKDASGLLESNLYIVHASHKCK